MESEADFPTAKEKALAAACHAFLSRATDAEGLHGATRLLTSTPDELIDAAIDYCESKGWLDWGDDGTAEQ